MTTRRSFLLGAAWVAVLPHVPLGPDEDSGEGPRRYMDLPHEPVPEGYPYDEPIPSLRNQVMAPLPGRVVAGYWTYWGSPIRLKDIPEHYNTVFLFHATPVGGAPGTTGAVQWNNPGNGRGAATHFKADLAEFRRARSAILTVGGARANVDLSTRARARAFLDSIKRIYGDLGGFDGIDWNNYEGDQQPNTDQMIWISQQLKATYGQNFAITSPPAPWRPTDVTHCRAMIDAGVMDMVSPQYYDGPGLAAEGYIVNSVNGWVARMGDASRVGVGFGLASVANYSTRAAVEGAWKTLAALHPDLRGAFNWNLRTDEGAGWPFANNVGPLVMIGAPRTTTPPLIVPPIFPIRAPTTGSTHAVVAGETVAGTATRYGITGSQGISSLNGDLTPESLRVGELQKLPDAATPASGRSSNAPPVVNVTDPTMPSGARLPDRLVGTYWLPVSGLRLTSVHQACNVVWIAFADAAVGLGNVDFGMDAPSDESTLKVDMAELRTRTAPPKIILSSFGGANNGSDPTSTTGPEEFAADIIRTSKNYGFDGFAWDLERVPAFTAAELEWVSRAIVSGMRETNPAFSLTVASRLEPSRDVARDNGRVYADFIRRCKDIIDLVQAQYHNRDDRVLDVNHMRSEVQAWLDCGLRQDQIGFMWMIAPRATAGSDSQVERVSLVDRVWDTLTKTWPDLRGMGTWSMLPDRANG